MKRMKRRGNAAPSCPMQKERVAGARRKTGKTFSQNWDRESPGGTRVEEGKKNQQGTFKYFPYQLHPYIFDYKKITV